MIAAGRFRCISDCVRASFAALGSLNYVQDVYVNWCVQEGAPDNITLRNTISALRTKELEARKRLGDGMMAEIMKAKEDMAAEDRKAEEERKQRKAEEEARALAVPTTTEDKPCQPRKKFDWAELVIEVGLLLEKYDKDKLIKAIRLLSNS